MPTKDITSELFLDALADALDPIAEFLQDGLHDSFERTNAIAKFSELQFWVNECIESHGVKVEKVH